MSEVLTPQTVHKLNPIQPNTHIAAEVGNSGNTLETEKVSEQSSSSSETSDQHHELTNTTVPQVIQALKPIYTSTFTKHVSESLTRCGLQVDYINPTPLGEGANHMVYSYDIPNEPPKVLKIAKEKSTTTLTHGGAKGEQQGNEIAKSTFGPYAADTNIVVDPQNADKYYVLQESVKGKPASCFCKAELFLNLVFVTGLKCR